MTNKNVTVKIVLLKNKKADGTYPVKLRITFQSVHRFFPCNVYLLQEDFDRTFFSQKMKKEDKLLRDSLLALETQAGEIIAKMSFFSFEAFEKQFYAAPVKERDSADIYAVLQLLSEQKESKEAIKTGESFKSSLSSLKKFKPTLTFDEVTCAFLEGYEKFMLNKGRSITTVGFYLRDLRTAYNVGIENGVASRDKYPFTKHKFTIPVGHSIKKALSILEIEKIFNYDTENKPFWTKKAKDFWCLSYLSNGMNMGDILKLKHSNIYDGEIHFERNKNIRKNRGKTNTVIYVPMLDKTTEIINRWSVPLKGKDNYLFDTLNTTMSAKTVVTTIAQFIKMVNEYMNIIGEDLGFHKNITTYVARHSFATVQKRSGATIEEISENLGHRNTTTTRHYLDSFEAESRLKRAQALVAFIAPKTD